MPKQENPKQIDNVAELDLLIQKVESEIADLQRQYDELSPENAGKMLNMFKIDKAEVLKKLQQDIADQQENLSALKQVKSSIPAV
ncbi:hypothetical protein KC571_03880 [candidate division WWE3 bacterium]|uniref:Uncharacterized protein n=1 Tax=candidate division WWE3 bacterium TaxID=2053526 RepID=A0A955LHF1_UNCKA|nr:hypothetical protein [candidate division WWE3 bacterium]